MTPATVFFASLSVTLWMTWTTDTWPSHVAPDPRVGPHVLRNIGWLVVCALGAAFWTLVSFRVSP